MRLVNLTRSLLCVCVCVCVNVCVCAGAATPTSAVISGEGGASAQVNVETERAAVVNGGAVRTAASAASVLDAGGGACAVAGAVTTDKEVLISTCNAVFFNCSGMASILLSVWRSHSRPSWMPCRRSHPRY